MKTLLVFSDSHGSAGLMLRAIERESPSLVIHLGDGEDDLSAVRGQYPHLGIEQVRGNCDRRSDARSVLRLTVEGVRILAVHGHEHEVKYDPTLFRLKAAALADEARLVLFGHTHVPHIEEDMGLLIMNPGSVGSSPYITSHPTYGLVRFGSGAIESAVIRDFAE